MQDSIVRTISDGDELIDNRIPIGISSCLLGERVRYDGGHKLQPYVVSTLGKFFTFLPFCPEMNIGLGVPRKTIRLVDTGVDIRCQQTQNAEVDVTKRLEDCAQEQSSWHSTIYGYILKKGSPSCGMTGVKVYKDELPEKKGVGVYARVLMERYPILPVEEEEHLGDPLLRENFLQRVFAFKRWGDLMQKRVTWHALAAFHEQHKLMLLSHDSGLASELDRALNRELALLDNPNVKAYALEYIGKFMALMKLRATRDNHVLVLKHIQSLLTLSLDADDEAELRDVIEEFRLGRLPLIVPITLLKHYFRRCPNAHILNSHYMNPHPREWMLQDSL